MPVDSCFAHYEKIESEFYLAFPALSAQDFSSVVRKLEGANALAEGELGSCNLTALSVPLDKFTQTDFPDRGLSKKQLDTALENEKVKLKGELDNFKALSGKHSDCDKIDALIRMRTSESYISRYQARLNELKRNKLIEEMNAMSKRLMACEKPSAYSKRRKDETADGAPAAYNPAFSPAAK